MLHVQYRLNLFARLVVVVAYLFALEVHVHVVKLLSVTQQFISLMIDFCCLYQYIVITNNSSYSLSTHGSV